jgi:glycosyltransferase involved in cell wall biosynthesis
VRILFVCASGYVYGKEIVTLDLALALRDLGHDIHFLTSTWHNGDMVRRLDAAGVGHTAVPIGFISRRFSASGMTFAQAINLPRLWRDTRHVLRSVRPDVIVHSSYHHALLLSLLPTRVPWVFHVHDAPEPTRWMRALFGWLNRRTARFVAVSRFVAISLEGAGVPNEKIAVVYNGVDKNAPALPAVSASTNARSGFTIGIVGQVERWKGHMDLFDALAILSGRDIVVKCKVFGKGSPAFRAEMEALVKSLGVQDTVEWMGFVRERAAIYAALDACVVPSRKDDPFPLAALEPALWSLPVIATNRGGLPEAIEHGVTGFVVESCAPEQLADAIQALVTDRDLCRRMGAAARQIARDRFSVGRMASEFEQQLTTATQIH